MKIISLNFEIVRATSAIAEFIVRVELDGPPRDCKVSGRAVGPKCSGISTVEVAYPMSVANASDTAVSLRCVIPEPNLWTPERRFTYEVSAALRVNGDLVDSITIEIAIKSR